MNDRSEINKVLVVLSPDRIRTDQPMKSALLRRAVALAKATGCELELFHVCYDSRLDSSLFASESDLEKEQQRLTDKDATRLGELAARLTHEGVKVDYEARWDCPRSDAILRKIAQAEPDLVMKLAREQSYFLGIATNTDWELARRSPAHIWLVNEEVDDIRRVLAAVGNKFGDPADVTTAADYTLLKTAGLIGDSLDSEVHSVNAYRIPAIPVFDPGAAGTAFANADEYERLNEQIERQHNGAVKALARFFGISDDKVHVQDGHPNKVIPEVAEEIAADLILLGANSIGRLERVFGFVTVEPVMAAAECDILIVRDSDATRVPDESESTTRYEGVPRYDLEHAIVDPEGTFESPIAVAQLPDVSTDFRRRILQAWEYDVRAEMAVENEGGSVQQDVNANALNDIEAANEMLDMKARQSSNGKSRLSGASA